MEEEPVEIDPLFIGMTRPPMTMGVPMEFFGINFMIFGIGMVLCASLMGKALFFACLTLPLHALGILATEKDLQWMRIFLTKMNKCPPHKNRRFWKCNSYRP